MIPLILFLHSLKPRGLKVGTTTLFLWERILRERPLGTRLGWLLRNNLLLILQILAALAMIAALADPYLRNFGSTAGDRIVVVDLSASMKAKGKNGSRFDQARREFLALVDELPAARKMMVIGAGPQPRLLAPFTADKRKLRELARDLHATDAPGRVKDAILFAHAFLKRASADRIVAISDGAFTGAEEFTKAAAHYRFVSVGGGKDNVAIVGFEVRRHAEQPGPAEIMVHVRNFTDKAVRVPLVLTANDKILLRQDIEIDADDRRVLIYPYDGSLNGTLIARLEIDDDFSTDNQAYLALTDLPPVRILYVGPGNHYLNQLLRFFTNVQLTRAAQWDREAVRAAPPFDLVIFDRVAVPALKEGNFILIDTVAPNLPLKLEGKIHNPRVAAPVTKHPLTEGLNLGDLRVDEALRVGVPGEGTVLARAEQSPLLYVLDKGKLRLLFIGFDLMASDLPLRVAFPVLFHNRARMVSAAAARISRSIDPGRRRRSRCVCRRATPTWKLVYPTANEKFLAARPARSHSPILFRAVFTRSTAPVVPAASRSIYSTRKSRKSGRGQACARRRRTAAKQPRQLKADSPSGPCC